MILDEPGLELAQGDARQLALALEVLESLGALGLTEILGRGFHQPVKSFQRGGQLAEVASLAG